MKHLRRSGLDEKILCHSTSRPVRTGVRLAGVAFQPHPAAQTKSLASEQRRTLGIFFDDCDNTLLLICAGLDTIESHREHNEPSVSSHTHRAAGDVMFTLLDAKKERRICH